ncbi:MAG: hypothetical protein HYZ75_01950 [Elusimicrobia bacterium]|nr:hypothetical protein [Elusimicrobiota bacterium]
MTTKKKKDEAEAEEKRASNLEQLILDKKEGKYRVVELVSYWAKQLRAREEHRHLTQTELLELALQQVLSGEAPEKDIEKMRHANPNANGPVEDTGDKPKKKSLL